MMIDGIKCFAARHPTATELVVRMSVSVVLAVFVGSLTSWMSGFKRSTSNELQCQSVFKNNSSEVHSSIPFLHRNMHEIDIVRDGRVSQCVGIFSGHHVLIPAHLAAYDYFDIIVYSDRQKNNRIVDGDRVDQVYINKKEDVAVYRFRLSFPTPFKSLVHFIKHSFDKSDNSFLISSGGWLPLGFIKSELKTRVREYRQPWPNGEVFVGSLVEGRYATYDYQKVGLCGSCIYSVAGGILGMHVAGDVVNNQGISILWSESLKTDLLNILSV
jgi:hypothetical protein